MKNPQVQTLIDTLESLNSMTLWYVNKLKDVDVKKTFEINGNRINSLYWIIAHLAQSEDELIAESLYKKPHNHSWLKSFTYGSSIDTKSDVSFEDLLRVYNEIHLKNMKILNTLSDSDLEKDNALNFQVINSKSIKAIIIHQIRHLGVHTGHLSLLCKINGIKTV